MDDAITAADLAERIRLGDAAAEADLVTRYQPGLTMLLRKQVKDPALADDLCQEVFQIALQSLRQGRLRAGEKLAAYLCGIARNLASTSRRRQYRREHTTLPETLVDSGVRPDCQMLEDERARLVREAVQALAPRDREVLAAFYLHDTPKDTICRQLGLSAAQFDLVKWRALKRLLAILRHRERERNG